MRHIKDGIVIILSILTLLVNLASSADTLTSGESKKSDKLTDIPDGGIMNLTFKSKIDESFQPLLIKVPKGYTPKKSWPLLVTLHGLGDGPILATQVESMVQIGPYGRGSVWYTGIGEKDVFECIEKAKTLFSIDEDRIYLTGFSMGGIGTFNLGLTHPDIWAACVPVCGRCDDLELIENGRYLPFWINAGRQDTVVPPEYSRQVYDKAMRLGFSEWKYTEYENMAHGFEIDWKQVEGWLLTKKRIANPKQVQFRMKNLESNRAWWVEVTELKERGRYARISAAIESQKINITTDNISNYTLRLNSSLIDLTKKVYIIENGKSVFEGLLNNNGCFIKTIDH